MSSDRHHGDRDHPQVVGERIPHRPSDDQPQRDADDDADEGQRRGLPGDRRDNLAVDEPQDLQEPDVSAAAGHAHHEQMGQRRRTEHGQHRPEDEREVDRLAEVDQGGGRDGLCDVIGAYAAR